MLMKKQTFILSIAVAGCTLAPLPATDYVHLSEIMYNTPLNEIITTPPYSNGEYMEIYNAGSDSVDLSGWSLRGDGSTEEYTFGSVIIPPQSFLLVAYRHARSPEFMLSSLFSGVEEGLVLYQDNITLKNTKEYVRLYDENRQLRDSVYYGNETTIQPTTDRLIAENEDGTSGMGCISVQRTYACFYPDGRLIPNHLDWAVAEATPLQPAADYEWPDFPRQSVGYAYDEAGNRTSRTIVLAAASRRTARSGRAGTQEPDETQTPVSDRLDGRRIDIYPNPTQGCLLVQLTGGDLTQPVKAHVYDSNGTLVLTRDMEPDGQTELDLSAQPAGLYILRLLNGNNSREYKIIKQ